MPKLEIGNWIVGFHVRDKQWIRLRTRCDRTNIPQKPWGNNVKPLLQFWGNQAKNTSTNWVGLPRSLGTEREKTTPSWRILGHLRSYLTREEDISGQVKAKSIKCFHLSAAWELRSYYFPRTRDVRLLSWHPKYVIIFASEDRSWVYPAWAS